MKLVRLSSKPLPLGVSYRPFPVGFTETFSELFLGVKFDHFEILDLYPPRGLLIVQPSTKIQSPDALNYYVFFFIKKIEKPGLIGTAVQLCTQL